jgi:hypothetical protein
MLRANLFGRERGEGASFGEGGGRGALRLGPGSGRQELRGGCWWRRSRAHPALSHPASSSLRGCLACFLLLLFFFFLSLSLPPRFFLLTLTLTLLFFLLLLILGAGLASGSLGTKDAPAA